MFINIVTKEYPINEGELRSRFTSSLPIDLTDSFLLTIGYAKVTPTSQSSVPKKPWDTLVEVVPTKVGNVWVQGWTVQPLALSEKKERMMVYFNQLFNFLISKVKDSYPACEVESWAKQEKEAREYILNNEAPAKIVRAIALARGLSVDALANRIVVKSDAYAEYVGNLIGTRQMLEDLIEQATEDNIDTIMWPPED